MFLAVWYLAHAFAATPQSAAAAAVGRGSPPLHVSVVRTNVVGRFALVLTHGGMMEGATVHAPILVERFSFGWQPIALLNESTCGHGGSVRMLRPARYSGLFTGMEVLMDTGICEPDSGPPADVTAVREQMRGPLVDSVNVVGDWALGNWYGGGGGETLFRRRDGRWVYVTGGGGAYGSMDLRAFGVPPGAMCGLHVYDARCSP